MHPRRLGPPEVVVDRQRAMVSLPCLAVRIALPFDRLPVLRGKGRLNNPVCLFTCCKQRLSSSSTTRTGRNCFELDWLVLFCATANRVCARAASLHRPFSSSSLLLVFAHRRRQSMFQPKSASTSPGHPQCLSAALAPSNIPSSHFNTPTFVRHTSNQIH
ncbi:conserved hypothetical protein [Coccidioides posadasii str. Silveira]|uniref:Uncharacterized protein n=1 Tax=Coccidioides posadasii (strain RMSCC 757 / Silveira) TaxID=443226 RepID=E9DBX0_COCPS|nr:conserved hypothetical protein [Coccidioides posadasii str. Silveira]